MKTRPGAAICAGVKQGVNEMLMCRAPDAVQRVALAKRCAAEPGPRLHKEVTGVPALRSGTKNAAPRPGHERQLEMLLIWFTV
jgi:hypothetical protein